MEGIVGTENLRYKHVVLFSDNTKSVLWTQRGAVKTSAAAGHLIIVLALQHRVAKASLLVAVHVSVYLNVIGNIPLIYLGYSKQRHCTNDFEFLSLINFQFPIPHQPS